MTDIHRFFAGKPHESLPVAALLLLAAGMLDAYTYVAHEGVFANAMTGNLVVMTVRLTDGDWHKALPFLAPIAAYVAGVAAAHGLKQKPLRDVLPRPARTALMAEIGFLVLVAFLPDTVPHMLVVSGIAFVAAMQATAFTSVGGFAFTSVTTSANLRRLAEGFMESVVFNQGQEAARQWHYFLIICLSFLAGALIGAFATQGFGRDAVWLPIAVLSAALGLCLWHKGLRRMLDDN